MEVGQITTSSKDLRPKDSCLVPELKNGPSFLFCFLVCDAATQLAQVQQRRIQVVRSNKVAQFTQVQQRRTRVVRSYKIARKRQTESNGTPAMDLGPMNIDVYIRILFWSRH